MHGIQQSVPDGCWVVPLAFYVLQAIALFVIGGKSNIKNRWVAFIPYVQVIVLLHVIDKNGWNIFLLFIPVVNIVLLIIWAVNFIWLSR